MLGKAGEFLKLIAVHTVEGEVSELHHSRCVTLAQSLAYGLLRVMSSKYVATVWHVRFTFHDIFS